MTICVHSYRVLALRPHYYHYYYYSQSENTLTGEILLLVLRSFTFSYLVKTYN